MGNKGVFYGNRLSEWRKNGGFSRKNKDLIDDVPATKGTTRNVTRRTFFTLHPQTFADAIT